MQAHGMATPVLSHSPLLVFLVLSIIVQTHQDVVPLGSYLIASENGASWASPSGDFAFGFHPLCDGNLFLLAVWFEKIPADQTSVVWSANRDHPLQKGSKVELTTSGQLVLYNHQGQEIWKPKVVSSARATSASMLDTGNFVLSSAGYSHIWGSFDEPTDTILPTQILSYPSKLSSRRTETDYSNGKFQLRLEFDGNLRLYVVALPSEYAYGEYWSTDIIAPGSHLLFNESGYINLVQTNGRVINLTSGAIVSTKDFYHRATLDFDGVFRQYAYPKSEQSKASRAWSVLWYEPSNMCLAVLNSLGSGTCGYNSYCILDEETRPSCKCPPGYTYLDPNNTFGGCKPDFAAQSCELGGLKDAPRFEMEEMTDVDWPLNDYELYSPVDEELCKESCLVDCFCYVSIFRVDNTCWKKRMPLSNGKMDSSVKRKAYIKVAKAN